MEHVMSRVRSLRMRDVSGWLVASVLAGGAAAAQRVEYPAARVEDLVEMLHGVAVADPYRWLENGDDASVQAWTEKQNALTRRVLDADPALRAALSRRLIELASVENQTAPSIYGRRYFFMRHEGTQNHAVYCVREGAFDAPLRELINPNTFSNDGTVALDWQFPSPDGSLVAYGKSPDGSERSTLYVRDVATGRDLELAIPYTRDASVAWDADGGGFHYVRYPAPGSVPAGDENYDRKVYHHRLGTNWQSDVLVYGEGTPKEQWNNCYRSSGWEHLFLRTSMGKAQCDLYVQRAGEQAFTPIAVGLPGVFAADVVGERLFLLTDYQAPRSRVLTADLRNPGPESWNELIPQQRGVIENMKLVGGRLVLRIVEDVCSKLRVFALDGRLLKEFELPTLGLINEISGRPEGDELFFTFQSFIYPPTVFRYDFATDQMQAMHQKQYDIDFGGYVTRQVWFTSKDGTRVPMFVIHRNGMTLNGDNPTILYGYGGFDNSVNPRFAAGLTVWLDRGGVFASANLRGGGEFGRDWHLAGRLDRKQNGFDDMIAAAEKLIADGYTRPERLGVKGASNGGLLVGAVITQRPELFRAAYAGVPLMDMLRYHRTQIARLWIPEYGCADEADAFRYLYAYSPYHRVVDGVKYPAVLLTTAESDSRVDPMHARKMAARLQAATASDRPVLLWVERKAGHGKGRPLSKRIEGDVDSWVFFISQLGMSADGRQASSDR
jgi:prolyl oligopeptidase